DSNNKKDFNTRMVVRPFNSPDFDLLRGLQFGCSYGVGIEGISSGTIGTVGVNPSTYTTPSTFEWFAYNSGVLANGVRTRCSPELEYFHNSFGFATQYFVDNQQLQRSSTSAVTTVPINGFYVMCSYLLTGETRVDYTQQISPLRPFCV